MEKEDSCFSLQSGTDSFVSRSRDVFATLGALEDKHSAFLKATAVSRDRDDTGLIKNDPDEEDELVSQAGGKNLETEDRNSWTHGRSKLSKTRDSDYEPRSHSRSPNRANPSNTLGDDCKQDVLEKFKRPRGPPQRLSRNPVPDFKKHPEKYTCYSLRDVSDQDMSEIANQRAAFHFLEEQRLEREKLELKLAGLPEEEPKFDVSVAACSQGKIAFSHPKQKMKPSDESEKSIKKDSAELSALKHNSDPTNGDSDEEKRDLEVTSVPDDIELVEILSDSSTNLNSFKSRKNVRRHIRTKGSNSDSD